MSVQLKILAACLCFVAIIAAVGGLAQRQAAEMGRLAIGIYDHGFMGMSYVDQAQADFLRFAAARRNDGQENDEAVQKVLDRLDVAVERAASDRTRETGQQTRSVIAGLLHADPADMGKRMTDADKAMVKLVKKFGADGLDGRDEAEELAARSTRIVLIEIAAAVGLALGIGLLVGRNLSRPLRQLVKAIGLLANGELTTEIPAGLVRRRDEIGEVARAAAVFRDAMRQNAHAEDERARNRDQAEAATVKALRHAADEVERETNIAAEQSSRSSQTLAERATELGALASRMVESFEAVTQASASALTSCEIVAAAGEELSASAREIGCQLALSTEEVANAAKAGERARGVIADLSATVNQIGSVARLIGEIAAKTNLLALNATIEAARAGEAGRGFAVVANEVKSLAAQTARSTDDIASSVGAIQAVSQQVIDAVGEMIQRVTAIEGITSTIATATDQQTSATGEIARNVAGTAEAMRVVASQMDAAATEARGTDSAVRALQTVAGDVSEQITGLRGVMVRIVRTSSDAADRRASDRIAIGEPSRVTIGGRSMPCICVNLSPGGARVRLHEAVAAGSRAVLRLEDSLDLPGTLLQGGMETGMRFDWDAADAPPALREILMTVAAKCAA